MVSPSLAEDDM